jgi:hypothetical protein
MGATWEVLEETSPFVRALPVAIAFFFFFVALEPRVE